MKTAGWLLLFLFLNFGGLALGNYLMNNGPVSEWYTSLNQAPWTPPGWVFGVAWTLIMICFSIYLVKLFQQQNSLRTWVIYGIALVLNISWNYVFFNIHLTAAGLINIILLTLVILYFFLNFKSLVPETWKLLLLPYIIWLFLATSLNTYIVIYN